MERRFRRLVAKGGKILLSLGFGVSAMLGLTADTDDSPGANNAIQVDAPTDTGTIETQIDENRQKLETMAGSSSGEDVDYSLLGC